jgi:hypothetical protein
MMKEKSAFSSHHSSFKIQHSYRTFFVHHLHRSSNNAVYKPWTKKFFWGVPLATADASGVVDGKSNKIALVSTDIPDYFLHRC